MRPWRGESRAAQASARSAPIHALRRYAHRYGVAMNRYEKRAQQERKTAMQASLLAGTIAVALLALALVILGMNNAAPLSFYKKAAIAVVILLLLLRSVARKPSRIRNHNSNCISVRREDLARGRWAVFAISHKTRPSALSR